MRIKTELDDRSRAFGMIAATERQFEQMLENLISARSLLKNVKGRKEFRDRLQKMIDRFELELKRIDEMLAAL